MTTRRAGDTGRLGYDSCSTLDNSGHLAHGPTCNCNYVLVECVGPSTWLVQMLDGTQRKIRFVSPAEYDRHF